MKEAVLDQQMQNLIKKHGIHSVVFALISACDTLADKASEVYDKRQEDYWRDEGTKLYAAARNYKIFPRLTEEIHKTSLAGVGVSATMYDTA